MHRRVLVGDSYTDAAESLAALLRLHGHTVWTAATGPDVLALSRSFRPDVVMLSINLHGLDGFEVVRQLRTDEHTRQARLVALTGAARPSDSEACLAAGFDAHLSKPAEPAAVLAALSGPG